MEMVRIGSQRRTKIDERRPEFKPSENGARGRSGEEWMDRALLCVAGFVPPP
jgi:hypothetical protein